MPNSWYAVAWSSEVAAKKAIAVRCFGRDLVVFRGEDGRASVLDAICPHLGAHLGVNGRVEGNTVVCPFHAWRFDGTGACVQIPRVERIPPGARVRGWPTAEVNGAIFAWYHDQNVPPTFEIPRLPVADRARWTAPLCRSIEVSAHVQEMNENLFDFSHFVHIHHYNHGASTHIELEGPFAHASLVGQGSLRGFETLVDTRNSMYGAGFTVIHVRAPIESAVLVYKTPTDSGRVLHRYAVTTLRRAPGVDRLLLAAIEWQVTRDVLADCAIWNNKSYLNRPLLVATDGPIMKFRKWHRQFFSTTPPEAD